MLCTTCAHCLQVAGAILEEAKHSVPRVPRRLSRLCSDKQVTYVLDFEPTTVRKSSGTYMLCRLLSQPRCQLHWTFLSFHELLYESQSKIVWC